MITGKCLDGRLQKMFLFNDTLNTIYFAMCLAAGRGAERLSPRDLRPDLALARPAQERAEAREVLPVRVRPQAGQRLRQPLPLREGRRTGNWFV